MIDVDHFKAINDTYGHPVGDAVLREIANRAEKAVRSYDFVGRYGGEEFIAVLSNGSAADLRTVAERTCRAVSESPVILQSDSISLPLALAVSWRRTEVWIPSCWPRPMQHCTKQKGMGVIRS